VALATALAGGLAGAALTWWSAAGGDRHPLCPMVITPHRRGDAETLRRGAEMAAAAVARSPIARSATW
jgi:hypothetical protein